MTLSIAALLHATGARAFRLGAGGEMAPNGLSAADLEKTLTRVSIDSRSTPPGGLFVALRGERVDGHDYVPSALAAGALGCLVSRIAALPPGLPAGRYLFVVPDSLMALQQLAAFWRHHQRAEVIGITGSIGKTTTKEILASVLAARFSVLKSEANFNTEIGLPLMLLRLSSEHDVAVLEMGMYAPGDIALLARIAAPRIGVVTNVAPIHLERLGTIERIARAKSELVAAMPRDGIAVLNADDPWTRAMARASGIARPVLVGQSPLADYQATDITPHGLDGTSFSVSAEGRQMAFRTQVPGAHTVAAFLCAIAVARAMNMGWEEIQEAVGRVRLEARQRILRLDPLMIIDDSYNASPLSMNAALELLRAAPGTKIAVLADMLELGPLEEEAHRQVGRRAAEVVDWLVVRGERAAWMAEEARRSGLPSNQILQTDSNAGAAQAVRSLIGPTPYNTGQGADPDGRPSFRQEAAPRCDPSGQWTVLVKGSRGMQLEEVVQALRGEL